MSPEALQPGSREPANPAEVDLILSFVPELAFHPSFEACVPTAADSPASHAAVDQHFVGETLARAGAALHEVAAIAREQTNGGLAFLVRSMLHFIESQPVPPSQHPLLVALYLRGSARATASADTAPAIAAAMDAWS